MVSRARWAATAVGALLLAIAPTTEAEVPPQRTVSKLPASNGHGAVMLDLGQAKLVHFREHSFAAEEPLLDGAGNEVWSGNQPLAVHTRDLLFDTYFGLRVAGQQGWLVSDPVDLDSSGYVEWQPGATGGTGMIRMVQRRGALELEQVTFMPRQLPHAAFVMALRVRNTGTSTAAGVSVFSLHNFHLGFGRPGVMNEIGAQGETVLYDGTGGRNDLIERAFAGAIVARPLGAIAHHAGSYGTAPAAQNIFQLVDSGGAADLPDLNGQAATHDDSVSGFQFNLGDLAPNAQRWVGIVFAHHGDPFAHATVQGWLDAYVGTASADELVANEIAGWAGLQSALHVPVGLAGDDETVYRQAAVWLDMAQVRETTTYLRQWLSTDGEPRYTRFGTTAGGSPAALPATVVHRGHGALLASLPPGEWTVSWPRDAAYGVAGLAAAGMFTQARDALSFYLDAEAGRFREWSELSGYGMPAYQVSLTRYHGFGVEETDFNDYGPNLEFDGFGLFLWALHRYEVESADTSLVDDRWDDIATGVADVIVALIDPATGLLRPDSSIWETHWNGRERAWAYTNITAARGLCDAAALAERVGDGARATQYREAGEALRTAIATHLTDSDAAIASTVEELATGSGYWDAAVLDAIAMSLFHPQGAIAAATLAGLDSALAVAAGAGWSRNDDRTDHAGGTDLSPWGSPYDSAEWVITDLRGAVATWRTGDVARSDRLLNWVRDQALANFLEVAETFDETAGTYKFNSPMMGFGAGAFILGQMARAVPADPACGSYSDGPVTGGSGGSGTGGSVGGAATGGGAVGGQGVGGTGTGGVVPPPGGGAETDEGCGCRVPGSPDRPARPGAWPWVALVALLGAARAFRPGGKRRGLVG